MSKHNYTVNKLLLKLHPHVYHNTVLPMFYFMQCFILSRKVYLSILILKKELFSCENHLVLHICCFHRQQERYKTAGVVCSADC